MEHSTAQSDGARYALDILNLLQVRDEKDCWSLISSLLSGFHHLHCPVLQEEYPEETGEEIQLASLQTRFYDQQSDSGRVFEPEKDQHRQRHKHRQRGEQQNRPQRLRGPELGRGWGLPGTMFW